MIILRGLITIFGLLAIVWGIHTLPVFMAINDADTIAARIVADEPFREETLRAALPAKDEGTGGWPARYFRSLAIIGLRLNELNRSRSQDRAMTSDEAMQLQASVVKALEIEPADAYLWLILAWLRMTQEGPTEASIAALRMSYLYGPYEGWVAAVRSGFVLSYFASLPEAIQNKALTEFQVLAASNYSKQMAEVLAGPGWPIHELLLKKIEGLASGAKQNFATELQALNDTIAVPGVAYPDHRYRQ